MSLKPFYKTKFCFRNYWRRRQPDLSQRAGTPAGFDRSQLD